MNSTIPTVDIAPWLNPDSSESARQHVVAAMRDACTTYGFFNLVGHGVAPAQRQEILDCAKLFFTLPEDEKMKVWIGNSVGRSFRGYEPPGIQTHQEGLLPDTKECFIIGHEVPATDPESGTFSTGPNLWPAALPPQTFQDPILRYQATMVTLVQTLLRILARGIPAEWHCAPDALDALAQNRPSIPMRLLHYAPQAVQSDRQFGGTVHPSPHHSNLNPRI
ncbi:Clavaminate synthase-like protein [Aspergillus aculeatinus CBS 121060]|uniref:Clavaminate synthase-like protein n=1 Tax=Aspergillus aculeatinus CBS 121060 TaxID=1448322 RepID=A0ACD1GQI5_9EURO|nr:Clavaminate synthase-like protein [Aspergillus aculeatinus CBS 121060]RAH63701.1 Clavaminate synthase-like protein [Aspergillus aculeatinus CBS 121060]